MPNSGLRYRVERLLKGEFKSEDLFTLFLAVRERSFGMQSVREIGDFVAHARERNKGIVTDELRTFFAHVRDVVGKERPIDLRCLSPNFPDIVRRNFDKLNLAKLPQDKGINFRPSRRLMSSLLGKFRKQPTGNYALTGTLTEDERLLLRIAYASFTVEAVFDDDIVFAEFSNALEKNKWLLRDERDRFKQSKPLISLFAIAIMHQCHIALDTGPPAYVLADRNAMDGTLAVNAAAPFPTREIPTLDICIPIFSTSLLAQEWCERSLLEGDAQSKWEFPIELASNRKLRRMG